jgi:hypothetical protein
MSISFACPQCKAQVEVGDEFAGHAGQCPRCQNVIAIPSASQPAPVALAEPVSSPREAKPKSRPARGEEPRRRRSPPAPAQPFGPIWPWAVGALAALVFTGLLISSVAVLVFWRRPAPTQKIEQPAKAGEPNVTRVTAGRLDGQRATLQNGVFQVRSALTNDDPVDRFHPQIGCLCKRFEIELRKDKVYVLEQESKQFDCFVRVENLQQFQLAKSDDLGVRNARLDFHPNLDGTFIVYATSFEAALGDFTLTIRERDVPKPAVP